MSEAPFPSLSPLREVNTPFIRPSSVRPDDSPALPVPAHVSQVVAQTATTFDLVGANHPFLAPHPSHDQTHQVKLECLAPSPSPPLEIYQFPPTPQSRVIRRRNFGGARSRLSSVRPSLASLGKRKAEDDHYGNGQAATLIRHDPQAPSRLKEERSGSVNSDLKPSVPIPILPIPLPSKRFKKRPTSKAVLIPVEQLPVFPLPPLPAIEDPDLLKQVFTHQSLFERARGRFEDPIGSPTKHYEKLEHVGDAILGFVVTTWLHENRPRLTIGTATKLKAHLVSNATLSHLSGMYNLPQRLNGDPELLPVLRAQTDVRAALLEAYIAALYFSFPLEDRLSSGIRIIDAWLREMYEPLYDFFYNYMKKEYEQHHSTVGATLDGRVELQDEAEIARVDNASQGMAILVQMYCTNQDRELRWEEEKYETNVGSLWKVQCTVDGIELGEGVRPFKKAAKNVAGWQAAKKLGLTVS
ncbi:hypothetical protein I317_06092 [Kwoniella heveanensis CBS 569]|nr:hypothetical protein I317_06092 [Kwoniella heveanensis CBS 569]